MLDRKTWVLIGAVAVVVVIFIYLGFKGEESGTEAMDFDYPIMEAVDFNEVYAKVKRETPLVWEDRNSDKTFVLEDGTIDGEEFSGTGKEKYITNKGDKYYFVADFRTVYRSMMDALRTAKVQRELEFTVVEQETTDLIAALKGFSDVTDEEIAFYRDGIKKLLEAAPVMEFLYQKQVGASPDDRIKAETDADRELIDRYGHPWCLADLSKFCVAIPSLPDRTSGVVPGDVSCEQVDEMSSPFEVVARNEQGDLVAVPYSAAWSSELGRAATILREAAAIFENIQRETVFAAHLKDVADAFESKESFPYATSDISWANFLASDSLLFARIGADETGGDGVGDNCNSKARFHYNIGLRNNGVETIVEHLKPAVAQFEEKLVNLIGNPQDYIKREIQIQLPIFLNVIYANGDDVGGPWGTPIGQTLPNWCGPDGKGKCMRGTMIYANKTMKAYSNKLMKDYVMPLFDASYLEMFDENVGLESTVNHEIFHNLGPRGATKIPGSDNTYGERLAARSGQNWGLYIEEMKAQTGSLYMTTEFYKDALAKHATGEYSDVHMIEETEKFRKEIIYDMAWAFRHILRGSRNGPQFSSSSPYSRLSTVQIGFLAENGALIFNEEAGRWTIDFDKMVEVIPELMKKVAKLYASTNAEEIEQTFLNYMEGAGEKLLHRDRLVEVAGKMPSALFDYNLKGL